MIALILFTQVKTLAPHHGQSRAENSKYACVTSMARSKSGNQGSGWIVVVSHEGVG